MRNNRRTRTRSAVYALLTTVTLMLTGCSSNPTPALPTAITAGIIEGSLVTQDGLVRSYRLFVPTGYRPGTELPLLIALHGGGGSADQFALVSGFDQLAEANTFLVLYPNGTTGDGRLQTWNGGNCCGAAVRDDIDDVAFISELIDAVSAGVGIDSSRIYASGHSNGGILALRLACELSDRIVAVGVQSAALGITTCAPQQPVSVLQIHGTADQNIPITGGTGSAGPNRTDYAIPIDASRSLATADKCAATPTVSVDADNADLTITTWSSCADNTQVRFIEVAGAPHSWMGSTDGASPNAQTPYPDLDSSAVIWDFLVEQHR